MSRGNAAVSREQQESGEENTRRRRRGAADPSGAPILPPPRRACSLTCREDPERTRNSKHASQQLPGNQRATLCALCLQFSLAKSETSSKEMKTSAPESSPEPGRAHQRRQRGAARSKIHPSALNASHWEDNVCIFRLANVLPTTIKY